MRRWRPSGVSGQLLYARPRATTIPRRSFTTTTPCRETGTAVPEPSQYSEYIPAEGLHRPAPSPSPDRALKSAKLAALHARLSLSNKIPLQTLARTLVSHSADSNPSFNNQTLSQLGASIINYHAMEYIVCKWPRLPLAITYEALRAFAGQESLAQIGRRWGVELAAAPGEEVDPGLLQWSVEGNHLTNTRWKGYVRADKKTETGVDYYRRGMSSRVVLDDDFGDMVSGPKVGEQSTVESAQLSAYSSFVQALVGAIYAHDGPEAKPFVQAHFLSRQVDLSRMFQFHRPVRELAWLCARENFEPPVARLESETGRLSRTPVFVVGIYSGKEKLGEGAGPSLDMARRIASMAALKHWYLYSPGNKVRVPSDMTVKGAKPWKAPYIDIGEVI